MRFEQLERILDSVPSVRKDGAAYVVPEDSELSLYVELQSEVLAVARISHFERNGDMASIDTHQGDRYYVPIESIALVKVTGSRRAKERAAGFR